MWGTAEKGLSLVSSNKSARNENSYNNIFKIIFGIINLRNRLDNEIKIRNLCLQRDEGVISIR